MEGRRAQTSPRNYGPRWKKQAWFWAKYKKDGSIDKNPKGAKLAGRVAKGKDAGCIACHQGAPGEDMVFAFDN